MSTLSSQAVDTGRHGRQLPPVCLDSGVDTGRQPPSPLDSSVGGADWTPRVRYVTEAEEARQKLVKLLEEPILGVDIETTGLDPHQDRIRLLSVAARDGRVAVFDLWALPPELLHPLSQVPWAVFNGAFEYRFLAQAGFLIPPLHDVQLLDRLVSHKRHRKLTQVAEEVLGLALSKEQQASDWAAPQLSDAQIAYAGLDAAVTVRLAEMLIPKAPRRVYDLWRATVPVLADLQLRGMSFDFAAHGRLLADWQKGRDQLLEELRQHLGADVKPSSGPQLAEWLERTLPKRELKRWPRTANGRLKTDAKSLELFGDLPAVEPLLRFKKLEKLISTYGEGFSSHRHPTTGRLHPSFRVGQTLSGRISVSSPNVQNPPRPKAFRALFAPPPDHLMIGADYSQIELRVAALLSEDRNMLGAYARGEDLHRLTAASVAGVALSDVTQEQRTAAKAVNFGNLFGQGPDGLAKTARLTYGVEMTREEARNALDRFHAAYPDLAAWKRQQAGWALQFRQVSTRLGLIRDFDVQGEGYLKGEACNIPIQGSAAEVLMCALVRLPKALEGTSGQLYQNVHDELLLTAHSDEAERVAEILRETMIAGFLDVFPEGEAMTGDLVEVHVGANWAEVH